MITVYTSCYNQGKHLSKAIESVLNQTYRDFEYLLFDDGSTDDTWEVMKKYQAADNRITVYKLDKQPNVAVVINKSIELMKGDYWVWMPSDDIFEKNLLEVKIGMTAAYDDKAVIYSWWGQINERGQTIGTHTPKIGSKEFAKRIQTECPLGCTGIWIPKGILEKVGEFPEDVVCSEDYAWVLKAVAKGVPFICAHGILYQKRIHTNRTTNRQKINIPQVVKEIRRKYGKN